MSKYKGKVGVYSQNLRKKGFSIVELIVVIAVVGILAAVTIPNFTETKQRMKIKACKGVVSGILTAMDMYSNEFIIYEEYTNKRLTPFIYPTIAGSGTSNFLDNLYNILSPYLSSNPKDSLGGEGWGIYELSADKSSYTIVVKANDTALTPITAYRNYRSITDLRRITAIYKGKEISYP